MPTPFPRPVSTLAPLSALGLALLGTMATAGPARSTPLAAPSVGIAAPEDAASLVLARDRSARADAAVDALKHALTPGHLSDPTPEANAAYGLETLRSEVADLQRKAAGYRATLGDRHPTLVGTEQVLAEFRTQLQDATRKALASAQHEAAAARTAAEELDRRLAETAKAPLISAADVTGSIQTPEVPDVAPALSAAPPRTKAARPNPKPRAVDLERPTTDRLSEPLIAIAAGAFALLLAVGAVLRLLRMIRTGARRPARRIEPALAVALPVAATEPTHADVPVPTPTDRPAAPTRDVVPVLATLSLPRANAAAEVTKLFADEPDGALAVAAAALHATLREATLGEADARLTVLLTGAEGLDSHDSDLAALALALAAARAGRRAVILEARTTGRLRGALVPAGTAPILVEAGGTERTLYRIDASALTVAVLPTDPGEAEAAVLAGARPETGRFRGLDAFDLVVLVGEDAAALARAADVVVITASATSAPEAVIAAARPCREAGRVCGALVLTRAAAPSVVTLRPANRRRTLPDAAQITPARIGLRGSIEPSRRRAGR